MQIDCSNWNSWTYKETEEKLDSVRSIKILTVIMIFTNEIILKAEKKRRRLIQGGEHNLIIRRKVS